MSPHLHELLDLIIRGTVLVAGILWIGNSRLFGPSRLSRTLHGFKGRTFSTGASGIFLLVGVYFLGVSALGVDAGLGLGRGAAIALGLGLVVGSRAVRAVLDRHWLSPLGNKTGMTYKERAMLGSFERGAQLQ